MNEDRIRAMRQVIAARRANENLSQGESSPGFQQWKQGHIGMGKAAARGVIGTVADLSQLAARAPNALIGATGLPTPEINERPLSEDILNLLAENGINLHEDEEASPNQRMLNRGIETGASFATPTGPVGTVSKLASKALPLAANVIPKALKSIPYVSKGVSKAAGLVPEFFRGPSSLAGASKAAATGVGVGALNEGLQQYGELDPLQASIASTLAPLATGIPYKKALPGGAKSAIESAQKNTAKILQKYVGKQNISKAVDNISSSNPELGYKPTTAEASKNVKLSQLQNKAEGSPYSEKLHKRKAEGNQALNKALSSQARGNAAPVDTREYFEKVGKELRGSRERLSEHLQSNVEKAKAPLEKTATKREAGKAVRDLKVKDRETLRAERGDTADILYGDVKNSKKSVSDSHAQKYIKETSATAVGDTEKLLNKYKTILDNKVDVSPEAKAYNKFYDENIAPLKKIGVNTKDLESKYPAPEMTKATSPETLVNVREQINNQINVIGKNPNRQDEVHILNELKANIDKDLMPVPEAKKASNKYREQSIPITELESHPLLGQIFKTNKAGEYALTNTGVTNRVLKESFKDPEHAEKVFSEIKKDKKVLEKVSNFINNDAAASIMKDGKVDQKLINKWLSDNPYATLYNPSITKTLKNSANAQLMVNEQAAKNTLAIDKYYNETARKVLGADPDKMVSKLMKGDKAAQNMSEIVKIASKDKTGAAKRGLQNGLIHDLTSKTSVGSGDISYHKFNNYLKSNKKAMEAVLDPDQMKVTNQINDILRDKRYLQSLGATNQSATSANLEHQNVLDYILDSTKKNAIKHTIKGLPGLKWLGNIMDLPAQHSKHLSKKMLDKALANPDYAKMLLMKPLKNSKSKKDFLNAADEYAKKKLFLFRGPNSSEKEE